MIEIVEKRKERELVNTECLINHQHCDVDVMVGQLHKLDTDESGKATVNKRQELSEEGIADSGDEPWIGRQDKTIIISTNLTMLDYNIAKGCSTSHFSGQRP